MATFKLIASSTVGSGGASSITFSSIPGTYTDLVLIASLRHPETGGSAWATMKMNFNGSTTNYSNRNLEGNGSTASSVTETDNSINLRDNNSSSSTSNTFSSTYIYIPNYAGSNNKSVSIDFVTENNATSALMTLEAGLWSNTSAITSIALAPYVGGNNFVQYSTAYLYGISNA